MSAGFFRLRPIPISPSMPETGFSTCPLSWRWWCVGLQSLEGKTRFCHWKWWIWKIFQGHLQLRNWAGWWAQVHLQGMNRNIFTCEYRMSFSNSDNPEDYRSSIGTSQKAVHGSNNTPKWDSAFTQKSPECLLFMLIHPSCGHVLFCPPPSPPKKNPLKWLSDGRIELCCISPMSKKTNQHEFLSWLLFSHLGRIIKLKPGNITNTLSSYSPCYHTNKKNFFSWWRS